MLIKAKDVKNLFKQNGIQTPKDTIEALNRFVELRLNEVVKKAKDNSIKRLKVEDVV